MLDMEFVSKPWLFLGFGLFHLVHAYSAQLHDLWIQWEIVVASGSFQKCHMII